jgi:deoxycytidine triphosphate deaminase
MSVLDLQRRITTELNQFNAYKRSPDSFVLVEGDVNLPDDCKVALDLSVGTSWYDHQRKSFWEIPDEGLTVAARSSAVIETAQKFRMPYNVFGLVTGKGRLIFQAVIICPGKIDPGFIGRLRIGLYNASDHAIVLERNEAFCSCCFFNLESDVEVSIRTEMQPPVLVEPVPLKVRARRFWERNWDKLLTIGFTALATTAAIITIFVK